MAPRSVVLGSPWHAAARRRTRSREPDRLRCAAEVTVVATEAWRWPAELAPVEGVGGFDASATST